MFLKPLNQKFLFLMSELYYQIIVKSRVIISNFILKG
nr:MAG TPA: hypothetical protein [Caudoviricetes sp.]